MQGFSVLKMSLIANSSRGTPTYSWVVDKSSPQEFARPWSGPGQHGVFFEVSEAPQACCNLTKSFYGLSMDIPWDIHELSMDIPLKICIFFDFRRVCQGVS